MKICLPYSIILIISFAEMVEKVETAIGGLEISELKFLFCYLNKFSRKLNILIKQFGIISLFFNTNTKNTIKFYILFERCLNNKSAVTIAAILSTMTNERKS